ncbi:Retrotransposon-like protein 1 [Labeo rohita]|uniref:Retrotransposon-like protein 1 n=1 Tax=Labeo rohita TaxID=84645 RepID=A0ABQ8LTD3_LABRO|nr:Retrotransposon-like protein 1 [Labeo rohita]
MCITSRSTSPSIHHADCVNTFPSSLVPSFLACSPVFVCSPPAYWTLALVYWFILLAQRLTDYVRHGSTLACFTDFYCASPSLYLTIRHNRIQQLYPGHSFDMDTDRILFRIKQGPRTLEQYIREFLAIANYSTLPDCTIIEIFCDGVNQPLRARLRREGPRSSLAEFMDFALMCVGSPFTMGVAEEERDATEPLTAWIAREMARDPGGDNRAQNGGDCDARSQDGGGTSARSPDGGDGGARSQNGGENGAPSRHSCYTRAV